ncbi:MAG: class I SAM-dependent methyltransferase [Aestuariibacter sp.]
MQYSWSEYWQNEGVTGECFVDKTGKKHPQITAFWQQHIDVAKGRRLLDLASGAGSIFVDNPSLEGCELIALDYSEIALQQLINKIPSCFAIKASASQLPFKYNTFDQIVSQFGVEYAGVEAIPNAYRYLKPGGKLAFLCHIRDGFVDTRNQIELEGALLCQSLQFVQAAKDVVSALYDVDATNIDSSMQVFREIEPKFASFATKHQFGVLFHLYSGFRQLITNRQKYYLQDILKWLDGMNGEIAKTQQRLHEIISVALNTQQVENIAEELLSQGAENILIKEFLLEGHDKPVAWHICARKPEDS